MASPQRVVLSLMCCRGRHGLTAVAPRASLHAALTLLVLAALAAGQPTSAAPVRVTTPDELLAAVNNGSVGTIHVVKPMTLPAGWGPARPARSLLIYSPYRVVLDWCDEECQVRSSCRKNVTWKHASSHE